MTHGGSATDAAAATDNAVPGENVFTDVGGAPAPADSLQAASNISGPQPPLAFLTPGPTASLSDLTGADPAAVATAIGTAVSPTTDAASAGDGWTLPSVAPYANAAGVLTWGDEQMFFESRRVLAPAVLDDTQITPTNCAQSEIAAGMVGQRVLAVLLYAADSGFALNVADTRCLSQSRTTNATAPGAALDITAVDGIAIADPGTRGRPIVEDLVERLSALPLSFVPVVIASLRSRSARSVATTSAAAPADIPLKFGPKDAATAASRTPAGADSDTLDTPQWTGVTAQLSAAGNPPLRPPLGDTSASTAQILPDGDAEPPPGAPEEVSEAIAAGNAIHTRPYLAFHYSSLATLWPTYDCSGATSYLLYQAGLMGPAPLTSGQLESWGAAGPGRWITIYANADHVWIVVAGIAFDTAAFGGRSVPAGSGPRWRVAPLANLLDGQTYFVRHFPRL
jgi:hypothetical protein